MLTIVEIISEAQQGQTRPFLCRGNDGHEYYVKRANAGYKALMAEWIAGSLGRYLNLPIPPFDYATVPSSLIRLRPEAERDSWSRGEVFASRAVPQPVELRFTDIAKIPIDLQARILLFDAWN